jgi:tRNA U54 and U55 pseudouridine synthase Pus10
MARKTILVSDLTGKEIDQKDAATVTIRYADAKRGVVVLDVNAQEVDDMASKGNKQARRGRKPKVAA